MNGSFEASSIPKISVIVPVYNVEKYLPRCMNSILNQTLDDIEIIMIDDGSPDNCPELCNEYAKRDSRVKVVHQKNQGLGLARNTGLENATGKYVTFVDSDDYIAYEAMECVWKIMEECQADMCVFSYKNKADSGYEELKTIPIGDNIYEGRDILSVVLLGMVGSDPSYQRDTYIGMSVWKCAYSRAILEENNLRFFSEREYISEDIIFQLLTLKYMRRVVTMTSPLYFYCENASSDSLTKKYSEDKFRRYKKLYLKELEMLDELQLREDGFNRASRMFLGNIRVCAKQIAMNKRLTVRKKMYLISEICNDRDVKDMLKRFPWKRNPWKQKLFTILLKFKLKSFILVIASRR